MHNLTTKSLGIPLGKLIGLVNLHKEKLLNQYLVPFGITSAQFKVLVAIHYYDMNSPAEICKYLNINAGSMTRMVERLLKKRLLEKQTNPEDKRSVLLNLTLIGRVFIRTMYAYHGQQGRTFTDRRSFTPRSRAT